MNIFSSAPKTVDAAIAGFTKAVADLRAVKQAQDDEAIHQTQIAGRADLAAAAARAEATRASALIDKLEALLD